ncbi:UDP-2,3-diacylglucosamine diphosphatase [Shewanella sp. 10N.286.48.A6]|uniref:UDP-2,3-diacylglucosamine diphosphatase n=1 Tax=Shewanella sp. 10N.286.48.A6 TaxID=1880833 RepID=UPI000C83DF2D|nr:UDP-2,3-diacylglucosamine diphosphatase [Shewanella sp. 10N.286.48.A6]PMI01743.1 UDP-2,3-diacylglucosamine diphosphatase [Shewanella sp. 10N.286.48.A6]
MQTVFMGDLHLSADRPDISQAFIRYLNSDLADVEAIYIIGDLFEVWTSDDIAEPFTDEIATYLKRVATSIPIYFIHGNRDFMIGKSFARKSGMVMLPEIVEIDLYGIKTVVLHGDSLCTLDKAYQRFRSFRNSSFVKWIYRNLPKSTRQNIAANIRKKSQKSNQQKSYTIMDVEQSAVDSLLLKTNCQRMIHGHTHRPAIHQLANNKQRIVVGDWYEQGSVLIVDQNTANLVQLPFLT